MTNHYVDRGAPAPSGWAIVRQTWTRPGLWINVGVVALPSAVFLAANAASSLYPAIAAAAGAALAGVAFRLVRREPVRGALIGLVLVTACAIAAAATGEARGFFLVPTLVPFAVLGVCLVTIIIRRPLTGLLLNRISGGPADWYRHPRLARIHYRATAAAIGINVANASLQVLFYSRNDTAVLALAHAATGPVFAALVAVTVVAERRALARPGQRGRSAPLWSTGSTPIPVRILSEDQRMRWFSDIKASSSERSEKRAGDDLLPSADVVMDRAFTVPGTPQDVWPWIVQLGKWRAGWYLTRGIERVIPRKRRASRTILPHWQSLKVGDIIPDYGGARETFTVAEIHEPEVLVYRSQRRPMLLTWAITLRPVTGIGQGAQTRVALRLRLGPVRHVRLATTVGELIDLLTIAGMAAGLRERLIDTLGPAARAAARRPTWTRWRPRGRG